MATAKERKIKWNRKLHKYAAQLNAKPPSSEVWFWKEWRAMGMRFRDECRNAPFSDTIPDVRSKKYKYIIEIDGPSHAKPEVRLNDMRKEKKWKSLGYRVYRVMPGDMDRLKEIAGFIRHVRSLQDRQNIPDCLRRIYEI